MGKPDLFGELTIKIAYSDPLLKCLLSLYLKLIQESKENWNLQFADLLCLTGLTPPLSFESPLCIGDPKIPEWVNQLRVGFVLCTTRQKSVNFSYLTGSHIFHLPVATTPPVHSAPPLISLNFPVSLWINSFWSNKWIHKVFGQNYFKLGRYDPLNFEAKNGGKIAHCHYV